MYGEIENRLESSNGIRSSVVKEGAVDVPERNESQFVPSGRGSLLFE
jgi:hypothetical protein